MAVLVCKVYEVWLVHGEGLGGSEGEIGGKTMGFGNRVRARDAVAAAAENHVQSDKDACIIRSIVI